MQPRTDANGKICISLLNTWDGPSWDPKTSTLMQVLVSIQALIFVDEPIFNEPDRQAMIGTHFGQSGERAANRCCNTRS